MVVRELIAKLGLKVNKKSFEEADKRIKKTKDFLSLIGGFVSVGIVAVGFKNLITLASDANETLNVLHASFGEYEGDIRSWAQTFGKAAGRSQFAMREMAGQLGAILNPLMEENTFVAAEMSSRLSELAVDLGSFYNVADDKALLALRSGLTGEVEPLKKFGIIMNKAGLEAFALEQGITKNIKSMSIAEKTQLRYNFLVEKTKLAHGDAAKTSQGFANASKGLLGSLKDFATLAGLKVLPAVEYVINGMRKGVAVFTEWAEKSNILEAAFIVLGAIAAKAGLAVLMAWGPALLPIIKFAVILGAAILVVDDFLTFLEGGDSVIGRFIDSIWGPGSAAEAVQNLKQAWQDAQDFLSQVVFPFWFETFPKALKDFVSYIETGVNTAIESIGSTFDAVVNGIKSGISTIVDGLDWLNTAIKNITGIDVKGFFADKLEDFKEPLSEPDLKSLSAKLPPIRLETLTGLKEKSEVELLSEGLRSKPLIGSIGDIVNKISTGMEVSAKRKAIVKPESNNITFNQKTEVNVSGGVGSRTTQQIVDKVSRKTKDINKAALRALTQTSGN